MSVFKPLEIEEPPDLFSPLYQTIKQKKDHVKPRVVVLAGPTAVGKTAFAIRLAQILGGEIVSADSMQVYQHMDIGTAKVTKAQQALIPHHLIDICSVQEAFNVTNFYHLAHQTCRYLLLQNKVPIIVGGSSFYLHTFLYGPPPGPAPDFALREELTKKMEELGPDVLYEQLQMLDPQYAATISERDRHKILRALEIILTSEKKVSSFPKPNQLQNQNYDFRCWFLHRPKDILYLRTNKRCEEMLDAGFINEVKKLKNEGLLENPSASQAIGYRQCLAFLDTAQDAKEKELFLLAFQKACRNYVKKQFTWFKKEPLFGWLDIEKEGLKRSLEYVLQDYEQGL